MEKNTIKIMMNVTAQREMHHIRKSNHRKMLKPKFYSSSSDDDVDDAPAPLKWKPIIAAFPMESNNAPRQNQSNQSNPIIDCLNSQMSQQQRLSDEVIQKDEIYNQAEMEANKKMFGLVNPGRCLTKDELKRRREIILRLVNERLKSKLSQMMGEFGQRLEMNDTHDMDKFTDMDRMRYGSQSPEDDDSVPEAPPPPTFNTSSESSDDDLDVSMTKEFELYEKEIKEKTFDVKSSKLQTHASDVATTSIMSQTHSTQSVFSLAASFNSIQTCPSNSIPGSHIATTIPSSLGAGPFSENWNIHQQTTNFHQQSFQQPQVQQWSLTAQSVDMTPWIPPVGPPQTMEPFPPPMEAEQMSLHQLPPPTQHIPSFIQTNPPPRTGWIPPIFLSNYGAPPPEWVNNSQSTTYTGRAPVPTQRHITPRMNWNERENRPAGPYRTPPPHNTATINRPTNAFVNSTRSQFYKPFESPNNVNIPISSKSTFVNAILAGEQNSAPLSSETSETKAKFKEMENSNLQKRSYGQDVPNGNSVKDKDNYESSNDVNKRMRLDDSKVKKSRFDSPKHTQESTENRTDQVQPMRSRNKEHIGPSMNSKKSPELEARHERTNAETLKFLSKYRNAQNMFSELTADVKNLRNEQVKQPVEWTKLCGIVDKLLDLSPSILKDVPPTDRRVKERNEILLILSDDPRKFHACTDKYGEHNVNWSVKMAQRILFPKGRHDDRIASLIAPFRNAISNCIQKPSTRQKPSPKSSQEVGQKSSQELIEKTSRKVTQELTQTASRKASQEPRRNTSQEPKEWMSLCKIVDKLLDIPTRLMETLPLSDSRMKERNDILMILSNDPEDFLLQDEKYGARNVDWAILAAKRIVCPEGVLDERVGRIMLRQRRKLMRGYSESSEERPSSNDRESRKRSHNNDHRARSIPKEWNQLCEIADKVLDIPLNVRMKLSKRDPLWEHRDDILIILSDDPDKLASESERYGPVNVDWAIKSAKKVIFPNGLKDKTIVKKLSPQRHVLLRNRPSDSLKDDKTTRETKSKTSEITKEMQVTQKNDIKEMVQLAVDDQATKQKKEPTEKKRTKRDQESVTNQSVDKASKDKQLIKGPERSNTVEQASTKPLDQAVRDNKPNNEPQRSNVDQPGSSKPVTEVAAEVEVDVTQVWKKLCNIVDKLLDLPPNAADKLPPSDKRLIERNEILMILADDPDNFSKFDASYGSSNVTWAINSAKKLIHSNGKPNEKLNDVLWEMKDAIMSSEVNFKQETKNPASNESAEWIFIRKIATKIFQQSIKNDPNAKKLAKEHLNQQIDLLLQLSDEPDIVRTKAICKKIGAGRVEVAIAKCKHILNRMRKMDAKVFVNFEYHRTRMVLYAESQNQSKNIKNYDVILDQVRKIVDQKLFYEIFGENFNKWTKEQKLERNELAILLIKNPQLLKSNGKYLEMVLKTEKGESGDIIAEVEKCLLKCEYIKDKPAESDKSKKAVCAPIIAKVKDVKFMSQFKERKLTQRIHRLIEQFLIAPKPEVFDVQYDETDGTVDVVCANYMTFNWLKGSVNELNGLWTNGKLTISKAPITRKVLELDELKQIKMTLKTVPTVSFATIMKQLKKSNSKLNTERWQSIPSNFPDSKKWLIMVDLESLIELERSKREINIGSGGTIYFDIKYIGKENFEANC